MSKKLSNNGLWESSRMMLPQHKEALLRHQHEQHRQERPLLDEMVWEDISSRLQWSMENREWIYGPIRIRCEGLNRVTGMSPFSYLINMQIFLDYFYR